MTEGIDYTIDLDSAPFNKGVNQVDAGIDKLTSSVGGMVAAVAGPAAVAAAVAGIGVALNSAIEKAAQMEGLETAFAPLLGGADAAQKRIEELAQFAADTNFELPEVSEASLALETLTKGALSTGDGLRLVGDVAATTKRPFDEMATTVGRLYDGLDSGRPVGEALARLQELGVISGDTRGKLEALQAEGAKGPAVWAIAEAAMSQFSGAMDAQSRTWDGKISTLSDGITDLQAKFGEPVIDSLKPVLDAITRSIEASKGATEDFGEAMAANIDIAYAAFESGTLGTTVAESLTIGFKSAVNDLWSDMSAVPSAVMEMWDQIGEAAGEVFQAMQTPEFWRGLDQTLTGIFRNALASMMEALASEIQGTLQPIADRLGQGDRVAGWQQELRAGAAEQRTIARANFEQGKADRSPLLDSLGRRAGEFFPRQMAAFGKAKTETGPLLDTQENQTALDAAMATAADTSAKIKAKSAAVEKAADDKLAANKAKADENRASAEKEAEKNAANVAAAKAAREAADALRTIPPPAKEASDGLDRVAKAAGAPGPKAEPVDLNPRVERRPGRTPEGPLQGRDPLQGREPVKGQNPLQGAAERRRQDREDWWNEIANRREMAEAWNRKPSEPPPVQMLEPKLVENLPDWAKAGPGFSFDEFLFAGLKNAPEEGDFPPIASMWDDSPNIAEADDESPGMPIPFVFEVDPKVFEGLPKDEDEYFPTDGESPGMAAEGGITSPPNAPAAAAEGIHAAPGGGDGDRMLALIEKWTMKTSEATQELLTKLPAAATF